MKINSIVDIKIFLLVVETESFTEAAELSGLSRSAVGKIIAKLEDNLQHRLFHRTTRIIKLSKAGALFYEYAKRILAEVEEAELTLDLYRAPEPRGKMRISVPVLFGRLHVMPRILEFQEKYPQLELEVLFSDEYSDLVREGIDLAIRIGQNEDSSLVQKVVAYHQYKICASPAYLEKHEEISDISDLMGHQCLRYLQEGRPIAWRYQIEGREKTFVPVGNITLQDTGSLKDAAIAGYGIVQLSSFLLSDSIKKGDLQELLPAFRPEKEPIYAVYPSKKYLAPKVRTLIDFIDNEWQRRLI